jgi:hypothetical protein
LKMGYGKCGWVMAKGKEIKEMRGWGRFRPRALGERSLCADRSENVRSVPDTPGSWDSQDSYNHCSAPFFRALVVYRCQVYSVKGADTVIQSALPRIPRELVFLEICGLSVGPKLPPSVRLPSVKHGCIGFRQGVC